jgi:alkanesulfonate monooxygenase SsuD/methylene tetrahydromethanopterin reductase-like flavin-dependent oxidoreductase (luciferase family)
MSGGRIELGLGAGWFEREHRAMGIPFPPAGERMDRLEELLEVLTAWWGVPTGSTFDHHGRHFHLEANPGLPRPVGGRVPLILGGWGPRRTPALAARFADEFNVAFGTTDDAAAQFARVRAAAESVGRDPAGLRYSQVLTVVCAPRRAEAERRAAAAGWDPARLATLPGRFIGSPEALLDRLGAVAGTGADTVYLQLLDLTDHDHVALIGESVAPVLRAAV